MKTKVFSLILLVYLAIFSFSCTKENEESFKNDFIKITVSPAIVGEKLEFKYALGTLVGTLESASAIASIEGASGTGFSDYSIYTDRNGGINKNVLIATQNTTSGDESSVVLVDTNAVTLQYYYIIPEAGRGQTVHFDFSAVNSEGQKVEIQTPDYVISKMDIKRNILLKDGAACYFSIIDLAIYTKDEVESQDLSNKIDFVYLYRATMGTSGAQFGHSIVSLSNANYLNDLAIPASWTKLQTKMEKRNMTDAQLKGASPTNFIDDIDLESVSFADAGDYALNFSADRGAIMQTADKTYISYVYINKVNNTNKEMTISIKRLKIK